MEKSLLLRNLAAEIILNQRMNEIQILELSEPRFVGLSDRQDLFVEHAFACSFFSTAGLTRYQRLVF